MGFVMKKADLLDSIAELKEADYSKNPKLGDIYKRLLRGREQFEVVMDKDITAVMQISSLDLVLNQQTDDRCKDEHQTAHHRRSCLAVMPGRTNFPNRLSGLQRTEDRQQKISDHTGKNHRYQRCYIHSYHKFSSVITLFLPGISPKPVPYAYHGCP